MTKIKNTDQVLMRMCSNWISCTVLLRIENSTDTLKTSLTVSYIVKHILDIQPIIIFLDIYPREMKTNVHTKTCI